MASFFSDVLEQAWGYLTRLLDVGLVNLGVELDAMLTRVNRNIVGGG